MIAPSAVEIIERVAAKIVADRRAAIEAGQESCWPPPWYPTRAEHRDLSLALGRPTTGDERASLAEVVRRLAHGSARVDPTPTIAPPTGDLRARIDAANEAARALRTAADRASEAACRLACGMDAGELLRQAVDCIGLGALHLDRAGAGGFSWAVPQELMDMVVERVLAEVADRR